MSRSFRNRPYCWYQYSPRQDFRNTGIEAHDGYKPKSRHGKSKLTSAWDDVYKGCLSDKWNTPKS